jgi:hypothetical protein
MSERDEIQLRRLRSLWQSRQNAAGSITLFLGFLTLVFAVLYVSDPGHKLAAAMVCLMVLLLLSCWRLFSSASRVVEIGRLLNPSRSRSRITPEIIEAEIIDFVERRA